MPRVMSRFRNVRFPLKAPVRAVSNANQVACEISEGQTLPQAAAFGWRPDMTRVRQRMQLAWKDGRFRPSVCISIDTSPEQANREANLIYELPE